LGRLATEAEIVAQDSTILPNGTGLPAGRGDAVTGKILYQRKCAACHGERGEGKPGYPAIAGGIGSLKAQNPLKTVGSYWPYATTVFEYIRRAMPYEKPRTLLPDEVYSITAFVLYVNGIIPEKQELNPKTLPAVAMPNRSGFVPDSRPDVSPNTK
jgi:cytochrome c